MTQVVSIVGTGNKTVDELVKKRAGMIAELQNNVAYRAELQAKIEVEVDEGKKTRMQNSMVTVQSEIEGIQKAIEKVGIRPATDEEKRAALQAITNMDQRRRVAPSYLQHDKAFVLVPVEKPAKVRN